MFNLYSQQWVADWERPLGSVIFPSLSILFTFKIGKESQKKRAKCRKKWDLRGKDCSLQLVKLTLSNNRRDKCQKNPKTLRTMLAKGHYSHPDINKQQLPSGNKSLCEGKYTATPAVDNWGLLWEVPAGSNCDCSRRTGNNMLTSKIAWSLTVFEALQNSTHSEVKSEQKWTVGTEQFSQLSSEIAPCPWLYHDEGSMLPSNLTHLSEKARADPGSGSSNWKTVGDTLWQKKVRN